MILRALIALLLVASPAVWATPQLSLLTGNRCSNCHVAPSGGGLRSELGWYSWYDVGMISRNSELVRWLYPEDESNTFFDGLVTLGMDARIQSTRSFSSPSASRVTFPMQATLYAAITPVKAMTIEGQFNLAALRKAPNSTSTITYAGQRAAMGSVILTPGENLPSVRVGLFRPSVGVRYDDHTVLPVNYVSSSARLNYLAPDWGEWGSELTWESQKWLSVNMGLFGSEGLSNVRISDGQSVMPLISGTSPTVTGRVVVWPQFLAQQLNAYAGGSVLVNSDFSMVSAFAGVSRTDFVYAMIDYTQSSKKDVLESRNMMAELGWSVWSPLIVYARYEVGRTTQPVINATATVRSMVFGAQAFVLPYVEVRPEYRIWDTELPGATSRWNVQLHVFY